MKLDKDNGSGEMPKRKGTGNPDARLKRSNEDSRLDASADRTVTEDDADDAEAFDELIDDWSFDKLPTIPNLPGFKSIWLSTTHPQDTIPRRIRLGYTPVTLDDVPELKALATREGEYAGVIACNEMLAFKLPEERWRRLMTRFHHDQPLEEEVGIKERVMAMREEIALKGGKVLMESGTNELGKARVAKFT